MHQLLTMFRYYTYCIILFCPPVNQSFKNSLDTDKKTDLEKIIAQVTTDRSQILVTRVSIPPSLCIHYCMDPIFNKSVY